MIVATKARFAFQDNFKTKYKSTENSYKNVIESIFQFCRTTFEISIKKRKTKKKADRKRDPYHGSKTKA